MQYSVVYYRDSVGSRSKIHSSCIIETSHHAYQFQIPPPPSPWWPSLCCLILSLTDLDMTYTWEVIHMSCNLHPSATVLFRTYHNVFKLQVGVKEKESYMESVAYTIQEIYIYIYILVIKVKKLMWFWYHFYFHVFISSMFLKEIMSILFPLDSIFSHYKYSPHILRTHF